MTWTEFVDEAARRGACDDVLKWARGHNDWPTDWAFSYWVLSNMHDCLSEAQVWTIAKHRPLMMLRYFSESLTDEQLWTLAQQRPWIALELCEARLTDEQLWTLAQQRPWMALACCIARLTSEQIKQLMEMV